MIDLDTYCIQQMNFPSPTGLRKPVGSSCHTKRPSSRKGDALNRYRLWISFGLFLGFFGLVSIACNLPSFLQSDLEAPVPTEAVEETRQVETAPVTTAVPTVSAQACLVGTWEINGLSDYVLAAIPPDMAEEYELQYQGTNGNAYFTLSPDGVAILQVEQLEFLFEARFSVFTVPITVSVDGQAVGEYFVDGNILTTSSMDTSGLTASAQAMGNDLADPAEIIEAIPLIRPPFNKAEYSCAGDTLRLELLAYPESMPPLVFYKVE